MTTEQSLNSWRGVNAGQPLSHVNCLQFSAGYSVNCSMSTSTDLQSPAGRLKAETSGAHQRTEKALVSRIRAITGPPDYASLLACLYGYFSPIEKAIDPVLSSLFPDYQKRRKSGRLLEDVRSLDANAVLRLANPLLQSASAATALGYAYVMEGSVLGGAIIKKMISGRFPGIPDKSFSFFSGYGEDNRIMWNAFLDVLNRELAPATQQQEGFDGANACFTGMEHWIEDWYSAEW